SRPTPRPLVSRAAAIARRLGSGIGDDSREPLLPTPAPDEHSAPRVGPVSVVKSDLEPALRQQRAQPLGPLYQRYPLAEGVLDAELPGFFRGFETVEVEMPNRGLRHLVDLHESEGRARNLLLAAARANK